VLTQNKHIIDQQTKIDDLQKELALVNQQVKEITRKQIEDRQMDKPQMMEFLDQFGQNESLNINTFINQTNS